MKLLWLFLITWLLSLIPQTGWADPVPILYHQLTGGEEVYQVSKRMDLTRLALEKGVRFSVLARHNRIDKPYRLKVGTVLKINNTRIIPTDLTHGIVINLPELTLYHFHQGVFQRRYALAIGRRDWPTPTGDFYVRNKAKDPTWVVPASIQEEMAELGQEVVERVPPGPKNPLGSYWLGLSAPGVGLHATNRPWTVGHVVSHGCMRMLPEDITELYSQVTVGTPVKIIYRPIKLAVTPEGRIYLEAHPDVYRQKIDGQEWLKNTARHYQLEDRLDWERAFQVLKAKEGIAQDVTKSPPITATTVNGADRLFSLQKPEASVK